MGYSDFHSEEIYAHTITLIGTPSYPESQSASASIFKHPLFLRPCYPIWAPALLSFFLTFIEVYRNLKRCQVKSGRQMSI